MLELLYEELELLDEELGLAVVDELGLLIDGGEVVLELLNGELEVVVIEGLGLLVDEIEDRLVVPEVLEEVSGMFVEDVDISTVVEFKKRVRVEDLDSTVVEVWVRKVDDDNDNEGENEGNKDDEGDEGDDEGDNDDDEKA